MTLDLDAYLQRIGYTGRLRADLETLDALHAAHINAVPFENLDVHAGRPVTLSLEAAYGEIVTRRRGGWCYEMNAVFGWALSEIGFEVLRLSAGVRREALGELRALGVRARRRVWQLSGERHTGGGRRDPPLPLADGDGANARRLLAPA